MKHAPIGEIVVTPCDWSNQGPIAYVATVYVKNWPTSGISGEGLVQKRFVAPTQAIAHARAERWLDIGDFQSPNKTPNQLAAEAIQKAIGVKTNPYDTGTPPSQWPVVYGGGQPIEPPFVYATQAGPVPGPPVYQTAAAPPFSGVFIPAGNPSIILPQPVTTFTTTEPDPAFEVVLGRKKKKAKPKARTDIVIAGPAGPRFMDLKK